MIAVAVLASLLMLGEVAGVREGSLICAVSTGFIVGWFFKVCPLWDRLFELVGGRSASSGSGDLA